MSMAKAMPSVLYFRDVWMFAFQNLGGKNWVDFLFREG
jgi:hypothetical protein